MKNLNKKFLTYLSIGIFSTLLDILIFTTLVIIYSVKSPQDIGALNILSFSIVVSISFFLNGYFTFKDKNLTKNKLIMFYGSSFMGMILNTSIVVFLMTIIGFGTVISKIIAACVILFFNYTMSKKFIFENKI